MKILCPLEKIVTYISSLDQVNIPIEKRVFFVKMTDSKRLIIVVNIEAVPQSDLSAYFSAPRY